MRAATALVVAAVQAIDDLTVMWLATVDHGPLRPVLRVVARAGDALAPVVAASLWIVTDGTADERSAALRGWAALAIAATLENGLVKPAIHRGRPDARRLPRGQQRTSSPSTSAFPSGHTGAVTAFTVATGRGVPRLRGWLTVSTVVIAYSHVYTGRHFLSDVVIGTAIGAAAGALCNAPENWRRRSEDACCSVTGSGSPTTRSTAVRRRMHPRQIAA